MTKVWRYMELSKILHLRNEGRELLGKHLYFTEKRDGSCLSVWLKEETGKIASLKRFFRRKLRRTLTISSRNMVKAEGKITKDFRDGDESPRVTEYLMDTNTHIVFGEILRKGLSPTRIENHEKVEFIVFDIFDGKQFLNFQQVHQFCYHYKMKCVRLFGEGQFASMGSLTSYVLDMLKICEDESREGVVIKTSQKDNKPLYAKEKLDIARSRGKPKLERGQPELPPLPFSEAIGAVDKAYADLGEDFSDKNKAMPLVARYIQVEMKKHICSKPEIDFYGLYIQYCKDHDIKLVEKSRPMKTKKQKKKKQSLFQKIKRMVRRK